MNKNLESDFRVIPPIALNQTFIHLRKSRKSGILNISSPGSLYPVPQAMNKNPESKTFRHLYALIHTSLQKSKKFIPFYVNHAPSGSSWTTQVEIFPGPSQLQKAELVLVSGKFMKNLKFPTSRIYFTHFHFEFLKDFYTFRISGPSGSLWYQWLQDSSSFC